MNINRKYIALWGQKGVLLVCELIDIIIIIINI